MDVSSLGNSVAAPRSTAATSKETADTAPSGSNATQGQVSQEAQTKRCSSCASIQRFGWRRRKRCRSGQFEFSKRTNLRIRIRRTGRRSRLTHWSGKQWVTPVLQNKSS